MSATSRAVRVTEGMCGTLASQRSRSSGCASLEISLPPCGGDREACVGFDGFGDGRGGGSPVVPSAIATMAQMYSSQLRRGVSHPIGQPRGLYHDFGALHGVMNLSGLTKRTLLPFREVLTAEVAGGPGGSGRERGVGSAPPRPHQICTVAVSAEPFTAFLGKTDNRSHHFPRAEEGGEGFVCRATAGSTKRKPHLKADLRPRRGGWDPRAYARIRSQLRARAGAIKPGSAGTSCCSG